MFAADTGNDRVEEFSATGTYEGQIGCASGACSAGSGNGELDSPDFMAIDASGNLWVADTNNNRVEEFFAAGTYEGQFGSYGTGNGQFNGPSGIATH